MEVGTYVEKALGSELSGNIIDLCPVGALTSKPYAFVARSWELSKVDSIDVLDAVGTNIRVDARGPEVLRILPRMNEDVNEEWLGDKSRFALDGLRRRRLDRPWVRRDGKLIEASWSEAFAAIAEKLHGVSGDRIGAVAGDLCDVESMLALKDLMTALGSANLDCRQDGARLDATRRDFYTFNTSIAGIEDADAILLIGTNPRREAPVLNARIRKRWLAGNIPIGLIGSETDLTYRVQELGTAPSVLTALHDGSHDFTKALRDAKKPMVIVGQAALARPDGPRCSPRPGGWRRPSVRSRPSGTASTCCTPPPRVSAHLIWDLCQVPTASRWHRCWMAASMFCGCSAPMNSTRPASAPIRSSSIRGITAMPAPRAPT